MSQAVAAPQRKSLLRSSLIMGSGSLASRGLGIVRVIIVAMVAAANSRPGEVITLATQIPTMIYFLIGGALLNNVFVPQIVRATKNDADGGEAYINRMVTLFVTALGAATIVCTILAPQLIGLLTHDSWRAPDTVGWYQQLLLMGYLSMAQIFLLGFYYIVGQVLNARESFGPMMWAPVVNNLITIVVFLAYLGIWGAQANDVVYSTTQSVFLAGGMLVAVLAQGLVMLPYLKKAGIRLRPRFDWRGTGLRSTAIAFKWVLFTSVFSTATNAVTVYLASLAVGEQAKGAGQTVYNNAYLIWQVPHGLITVSLATALMPTLTSLVVDGDMKAVARETTSTLRLSLSFIIPVTVALMFLAQPVAGLLFSWKASAGASSVIGWTLFWLALSYPVYTLYYYINRCFYALEDTRTAFFIGLVVDGVVLVAAIALVFGFRHPDWVAPLIAIANLLGFIPGCAMGIVLLHKRVPLELAEVLRLVVRLVLASLPAGAAAWWIDGLIRGHLPGLGGMVLGLLAAGTVGIAAFLGGVRLFHIEDVTAMLSAVQRRLRRGAPAPEAGNDALTDVTDDLVMSAELDLCTADIDEEKIAKEPEDDGSPVSGVQTGQLLGARYRLTEQITRRNGTLTWTAFDEILSRTVLVHILAPHEDRSSEVLAAARRAAIATDSRFLRVLDAVYSDDDELGSYVVCEYVEGASLEQLLARGPLNALEAGWIVRELADALTVMHMAGLHHERLDPDTVVVSTNGNVKVVGFLIEKAIRPLPGDADLTDLDREAHDVTALGELLYAGLVARWVPGAGFGLSAAPHSGGQPLTPRQVKAGISPALDQICDQILSRPPHGNLPPLRTAHDVLLALSKVIGSADGSPDLERRLRAATRASASSASSARSGPSAVPKSSASGSQPTVVLPVVPAGDDTPTAMIPTLTERPAPFTPVPAPSTRPDDAPHRAGGAGATVRGRHSSGRGLAILIGLVVLSLVVGLALTLGGGGGGGATASPTVSATPSLVVRPIAAARDFDPLGSKNEVPEEVPFAVDGNADTVWHTEVYEPAVWQRKGAVGLWVDLGSVQDVSRVDLALLGEPSSVAIYVVDTPQAPETLDGWRKVGEKADAPAATSVTFAPVKARYALVWFTAIPVRTDGFFQGGVAEVSVSG